MTEVVASRLKPDEKRLLEAVAARRGYRYPSHLMRELMLSAIREEFGPNVIVGESATPSEQEGDPRM